jgi:thiol-disulfide isomerase/thioredoxin
MIKRQKIFLAGALFLSASILFSASVLATQQVEMPSPDCAFTTLEGSPTKGLRSMQGEVVYVDFWASWCPPCVKSFPFLNQMEHEFKAQGLHVIGVNLDEKKADAQAFLDKNPVDFEIVADQTKQCAKDFGVIAMPSSFLIDRKGNVRYVHQGFRAGESDQLRMMVEQVLAEKH